MIRPLFIIFLLLTTIKINAQDSLVSDQRKIKGLNISYFGEYLTHYGLKIGIEYPIWIKEKVKTKKSSKEIPKQKLIFISGNIGGYFHKRNHIGIFVNSEIGYRKTRLRGFRYEFLIGLGYFHTFLQGDTYEVNDDGSVERIPLAGQANLMIPISAGIGYDFKFCYNKPFNLYLKPGFFIQYPYNLAIAIRPTIEFGLFYYFTK
jgi:hypothetical protein